jgi:hypothetical protein
MAGAGHTSPAAALRYQHATADRDAAIAAALSGLAETARARATPQGPRDIRGTDGDETIASESTDHRLPGPSTRAADRDRTGIISLEG